MLPSCLSTQPAVSITSPKMKRKAASQPGLKRASSKRSKTCKSSFSTSHSRPPLVLQTADFANPRLQPFQNQKPRLASGKDSSTKKSWTLTPRATLNRPPTSTASSTAWSTTRCFAMSATRSGTTSASPPRRRISTRSTSPVTWPTSTAWTTKPSPSCPASSPCETPYTPRLSATMSPTSLTAAH